MSDDEDAPRRKRRMAEKAAMGDVEDDEVSERILAGCGKKSSDRKQFFRNPFRVFTEMPR